MKLVFIFTEHGSGYTDKGLDYIREKLSKNYQEMDELAFMSGADLNDVKTAIGLLKDHVSDGYAIISKDDGIDILPPGEGIESLAGILEKYGGENTWQTLTSVMAKTLAEMQMEDPDFKLTAAK